MRAMSKILAVFTGEGFLEDPDGDTTTDDAVAAGVPFETTAKRLKELQAQGIPVSEAPKAPTTEKPAKAGDDA